MASDIMSLAMSLMKNQFGRAITYACMNKATKLPFNLLLK